MYILFSVAILGVQDCSFSTSLWGKCSRAQTCSKFWPQITLPEVSAMQHGKLPGFPRDFHGQGELAKSQRPFRHSFFDKAEMSNWELIENDRNLLSLTGVYIHVRASLAFTRVPRFCFRIVSSPRCAGKVCLRVPIPMPLLVESRSKHNIICCSLCVYCILILFR